MAVPKRVTKKRQLSVSQQLVLEKVKQAFADVISVSLTEFFLDENGGDDDILQLWDCFAEAYIKIQSLSPEKSSMEDKRQIIADLMVWSSMETYDLETQRFILAPHLEDRSFLSTGHYLREAMADRGLLATNKGSSCISTCNDAESEGSTSGKSNQEDNCDQEHSSKDLLPESS